MSNQYRSRHQSPNRLALRSFEIYNGTKICRERKSNKRKITVVRVGSRYFEKGAGGRGSHHQAGPYLGLGGIYYSAKRVSSAQVFIDLFLDWIQGERAKNNNTTQKAK